VSKRRAVPALHAHLTWPGISLAGGAGSSSRGCTSDRWLRGTIALPARGRARGQIGREMVARWRGVVAGSSRGAAVLRGIVEVVDDLEPEGLKGGRVVVVGLVAVLRHAHQSASHGQAQPGRGERAKGGGGAGGYPARVADGSARWLPARHVACLHLPDLQVSPARRNSPREGQIGREMDGARLKRVVAVELTQRPGSAAARRAGSR